MTDTGDSVENVVGYFTATAEAEVIRGGEVVDPEPEPETPTGGDGDNGGESPEEQE